MTQILIADDNEQNLYMLQVLLTGYGYQVVSADNGAKALEIALRDPPDMIVTDILMPVMDGFTLCREWKNDARLKTIPFVFYTATYTDPKDEEFALGLGAERFIVKPAEPEVLMGILQGIIAEYEAGQLVADHEPTDNDETFLRQYSQTLVRKLEAKVAELGESNRALQLEIEERIQAEAALHKVNRAYRTLSGCNEVLIRAQSEPALLQAICQTIVETGGYRLAWVGFAEQDKAKTVRPMAYAGHEADFLDTVIITWDDSELGHGPTGTAIRTGELVTVRHIPTEPDYEPWRAEAIKRGYASSISLPLIIEDQVIGALVIYAGEPEAFDQQELGLLAELAGDLAFGIHALRMREERERAQEMLAQERNLLRTLIDNLPDFIYAKDTEGRFIIKNEADAFNMGAKSAHEVVGKSDFDYYPQELAECFRADDQQVIQSGQPLINREEPNPDSDGNPRWFLTTKVPLRDGQGKVIGLVGIGRDITERKHREEQLRSERDFSESLIRTAQAIVLVLDPEGRIVNINPYMEELSGYSLEEVRGKDWLTTFLPERDQNAIRGVFQKAITGIQTRGNANSIVTREGQERQIEWHDKTLKDANGTPIGLLSIGLDVTERMQAEQQLQELNETLEQRVIERTEELNHAKERIETILNSSSDMMILCRTDGTIEQVNPAFVHMFGDTSPDVDRGIATLAMREQTPLLQEIFETVVKTQTPQRLELSVSPLEGPAFDGDLALSPVLASDNQLLGVVCSLRDITKQKQMEAQLRQMLEHEMALSELKSRYVSIAAHDLRNPLAVIQSAINVIHQYGDRLGREKLEKEYTHIQTSIGVMVRMLDDILIYERAESGKLVFEPAPLDVIAFCRGMADEIGQAVHSAQRIVFSSEGDCGVVPMDARLLRHILSNLLSNALKYSPGDSPVIFTVRGEPDQITFRVQDQGIGIPKTDQKHLFETFHRASNARHVPGTGLGLAIVKQSVELYGGTITFESEEGIGTTFTVTIPQIDA